MSQPGAIGTTGAPAAREPIGSMFSTPRWEGSQKKSAPWKLIAGGVAVLGIGALVMFFATRNKPLEPEDEWES